MKRTIIIGMIASLVALVFVAPPVIQAQDKTGSARAKQSGARGQTRAYAPRVIGRSNISIVEGRIAEIRNDRISIKSSRGLRQDFNIDDQTTVLDSGEIISIATMSDIALSISDLRVSDWVEIVSERASRSPAARIITRIAERGTRIASR